jgi:hypothetical protein
MELYKGILYFVDFPANAMGDHLAWLVEMMLIPVANAQFSATHPK